MLSLFLKKIFGSRNDRLLKHYKVLVEQINSLEAVMQLLTDEALREKSSEFKTRHHNGESLDALLPEAFAVCREGAVRCLHMRHFDVQLIGGITLHQGKIAEMRTGEGKTLVATLPAYLNAIAGHGVQIVTVNDYLASRDAASMGKLYQFLGLSCGVNLSQMSHEDKKAAYSCDITYGTNNEFGFDYLRDNMVFFPSERVQRDLAYAIVDEVDSILIDEARTPLIISGPADDSIDLYKAINSIPPRLTRQTSEEGEGDYWVDEKANAVLLSESGHEAVEHCLKNIGLLEPGESLYGVKNISLMYYINAALRAHTLFHRDQHYVLLDGEVVIVDEFTGRLMAGRRWSEGLHQAIEAKEGVEIRQENQTLATITLQNYFRLYTKLAGMTGTADTEAYEFQQIYSLETVLIPTNQPMIRQDLHDQVYKTAKEKYQAILADIEDCTRHNQPVLVGTISIEQSELLSKMLKKQGIAHNVLNAKQHAREADIITQAGRPGMVTIATNMAGRGTDIVLGGNIDFEINAIQENTRLDESQKTARIEALRQEWQERHKQVLDAGGLHIIGTERHESRRIDNQLRGRSGRQGDPGSSRFYLSLEDGLLRIFAGERVAMLMDRLKIPEGEPIEAKMVNRAIESAQRKVEGRNFDIRKQLLEYDDVSNEQRKAIYKQRNEILKSENVSETIVAMVDSFFAELFEQYIPENSMEEEWDRTGLKKALHEYGVDAATLDTDLTLDRSALQTRVKALAQAHYKKQVQAMGEKSFQQFERGTLLQHLDQNWREHLSALDHLRQGIHLRGYAQKNPKQEYKREAFELFSDLLSRIQRDVIRIIMNVQVRSLADNDALSTYLPNLLPPFPEGDNPLQQNPHGHSHYDPYPGVRRNAPCPCGSEKKYKHCHGKLT